MAAKGRVAIVQEWCKACRICVALCSAGVLSLEAGQKAQVSRPESCTGCRSCELHCPELAVEVSVAPRGAGREQPG